MNCNNNEIVICKLTNLEYENIIKDFEDATLYNSWAFGSMNSFQFEHILLKRSDKVKSCAQIRLYKIHVLNIGIGYVLGPLWKRKCETKNYDDYKIIVEAIIQKYAIEEKIFIKLVPVVYDFDTDAKILDIILKEVGYIYKERNQRVLLMSLKSSLEEIRKKMSQKWRNQLNAAERKDLTISIGKSSEYIEKFAKLYTEMCKRKKFDKPKTIIKFISVYNIIPFENRPIVFLCKHVDEIVAGAVFSTSGNVGIYSFGATNETGMALKASYLIQWEFIKWLKENDFEYYDLSGINPEKNPNTFHFKNGLAGNIGVMTRYMGNYYYSNNIINDLIIFIVNKIWRYDI